MANGKGVIGAVFRYKNPSDFYMVEFTSNLIKVRKRVETGANIVERTRAWTMVKDKWYTVRLDFKGTNLILYAQKAGEHPIMLMKECGINEILEGRLGLYTYNTEGAFDNIKFFPHFDIEPALLEPVEEDSDAEQPIMKGSKGLAATACLENKDPEE